MSKFNLSMLQLMLETISTNKKINPAVEKLFSGGFIVINDCYFLKNLFDMQQHINPTDFIDKTGYECFVNSIHIDDYVENDFFVQSAFFVNLLFREWKEINNNLKLKILMSKTDFGLNIKFHVSRNNESWINENDINSSEEPLMICTL